MAGRRVYGGSEMTVLLQNEGISADSYEGLISSSSSHGGFNGSRSMLNFEDVCGTSTNNSFYRAREIDERCDDDDFDECLHQPKKKRRLAANQVQFLEKSFEVENKLEPERKIQLAKDLGLQPRQIAIWFQNRRARWKTKQLEKDYDSLKSSYNTLRADYDNLLKEKEKLKAEVVHLSDKLNLPENHKGISEAVELDKPSHNPTIDINISENKLMGVKQEDDSSTNSAVSDSGSTRCPQSDISYVEEEEVKEYHEFLKLEDHAGSFDFPVEDHSFWLWA